MATDRVLSNVVRDLAQENSKLNQRLKKVIKAKEHAVQTRIEENKRLKRELANRDATIRSLEDRLTKIKMITLRF